MWAMREAAEREDGERRLTVREAVCLDLSLGGRL